MPPESSPELAPPQNVEAEMCLLGSIILDNDVMHTVVNLLDRAAFYRPSHAQIFDVLVDLYDARKPADVVILTDELTRRGLLEQVGGPDFLTRLLESVPTAANADYYAGIVREKAIHRSVITICTDIIREAQRGALVGEDLLDKAERMIFTAVKGKGGVDSIQIGEILRDVLSKVGDIRNRGERIVGLSAGFPDLDDIVGGFRPSQFIVLAGRPSMGKTSLALRMAENVGLELKKPTLIFSLEMAREQVAQVMVCSHARLSIHDVGRGRVSDEELQRLMMSAGTFQEAPIYIDDSPGLSVLEIKARARRMSSKMELGLVVVDYLQLMEMKHRQSESRQQEVSMISRALKELAKELKVPVMALSQLSRAVESREDRTPRLSDLRESGAIEQDADVVMLIHRPDEPKGPEENPATQLIVAKNRMGPTDKVNLTFLAPFMRFESYSGMPEPVG